ncbi:MAG: acylneuraminate cytidylyltransferase [Anaerolineales bacterium]|nr:acylneuraminate cytidylyltransferase [Anaerolineales bacterium]
MVNSGEVLAIIPARGGSKSLPKKNIIPLGGYPLLAYSIAAGQQAAGVGRVIVSTDDEEIASIARSFGAEVPFIRPKELAQDHTLDLPVFEHALAWLAENEEYLPEIVLQLRPTSPFRPLDLVDKALDILHTQPEADSVRGVVTAGQNPYKMWRINESGSMIPLLEEGLIESYNMPRQELPVTYWQTGHIDAIRIRTILEQGSMSGEVIFPVMIDSRYSVDIDSEQDWRLAEGRLESLQHEVILPGRRRRKLPGEVELVVLDFDGVMTDNRVWVDADSREWVAANRSDGWGIARLKDAGVDVVVLSTETNPVVKARCDKLGLPVHQGIVDKEVALKALLKERGINSERVIYLGNDVNDLPCFPLVGCALVVADAHPQAKMSADVILQNSGGHGAVRELCDRLLEQINNLGRNLDD